MLLTPFPYLYHAALARAHDDALARLRRLADERDAARRDADDARRRLATSEHGLRACADAARAAHQTAIGAPLPVPPDATHPGPGGGAQRGDARTDATPSSLDLIFDDANRLVAPLSRSPGASPLALRLPFG